MGSSRGGMAAALVIVMVMMSTTFVARATLTPDYYDETCPCLFDIVREVVNEAFKEDPRNAASLVRLHFHDCFVQGCDGSLLFDNFTDGSTFYETEKDAPANFKSVRGFNFIDDIKTALEEACPNTVSCADILALASRDSAIVAGLTKHYYVLFGRLDSFTPANTTTVNSFLPAPTMNFAQLKQNFQNVGLSVLDLATLSGAHTIGRVNCSLLTGPRLDSLNNISINNNFKDDIEKACKANSNSLQNLDLTTPNAFDNKYYTNLEKSEGILISDQSLYSTRGAESVEYVKLFADKQDAFFEQFVNSTIKMGNIGPKTGDGGEIRINCRVPNSLSPDARIAYNREGGIRKHNCPMRKSSAPTLVSQ